MGSKKQRTYVLYHRNCMDGFGAAWAAWKSLGDGAKYIPVAYHDKLPNFPDGSIIYILDFCYPREVLLDLHKRMAKVVVLDHHKTSRDAMKGLDFAHFDMSKSGAVLAWEYFHYSLHDDDTDTGYKVPEPVPTLLKYVQDRDLWEWKLPHSKEVSAALFSYPKKFKVWDELRARLDEERLHEPNNFNSVVAEGRAILRSDDRRVDEITHSAYLADICGHEVPVVNCNQLISEVGNTLLEMYPDSPFAACYFELEPGVVTFSLRSREDFDVGELAKTFGGGGHPQAAGFKVAVARSIPKILFMFEQEKE